MLIDSSQKMTQVIRHFGIIPFFKSSVPGWSIEELTDPNCWFYSSDELGPWDWKIDALQQGDIAYGKFLSYKAAFATIEWYHHLMNWRRSEARFRVALGERFPIKNTKDKLLKYLSPIALNAIRKNGSLEMSELRRICGSRITDSQIKALGGKYTTELSPAVKKSVMDSVMQFLDMGTWTIIGDFTRVYRGASLEYTGWQRSSITTPDAFFGELEGESSRENFFWTKYIKETECDNVPNCSPQESKSLIIEHLLNFFPDNKDTLEKVI